MGKEWSSRERFLAAVDHKEPDRIPINIGGCAQSTILECPPEYPAVTQLYHYLGLTDYAEPVTGALANQVYNLDARVMDRFGSDFRLVLPGGGRVMESGDGTRTILGTSCGLRVRRIGMYDDVFEYPLQQVTTIRGLHEYPYWPTEQDFQSLARGRVEEVARLAETSGKVVLEDSYKAFPHLMYALLSGTEKWLIDMKTEPHFYFALCDRLFEIGLKIIEYWIKPVGPFVDVVGTYDDLGTQGGLFVSPDDYVKYMKPYEKEMIGAINKVTNAKIYRHSCGSVYELIPDLIEIGVEILNPVQPLARNMEPWRLKKEYGKYLTFFGGLDTQQLLYRSPEEVRQGVRELISCYAPGGGYIFGTSHNIEPDTPTQNIVAAFEAALDYGSYPIIA